MDEQILKNPITNRIQNALNLSTNKLNFAVPFLNSFATTVLNENNTRDIVDKRLLARFDETNIISFDLPTLKKILDLGFIIKFDNKIHLKLYITDKETFVTSSNFTKGGFENNVELTIKVDSENITECNKIFNDFWENAKENFVTYDLIGQNWSKYNILKKREQYENNKSKVDVNTNIGEIDIQKVISSIFNLKEDYSEISSQVFEANKLRENVKNKLRNGFNQEIFYVSEGNPNRKNNLFYDFTYGHEASIASTGLRELQFKTVFENKEFKNVIEYIFPEMVGMKPWNLNDNKELLEFCHGIFDYKIPQYTEALPLRLASYFYPEYFVPIFNLEHLKKISDALNINTNAKSKGERFYAYTTHITEKMKFLPFDNSIKSRIAYNILYTLELRSKLINGEDFEKILSEYKQIWKKRYISKGLVILETLK